MFSVVSDGSAGSNSSSKTFRLRKVFSVLVSFFQFCCHGFLLGLVDGNIATTFHEVIVDWLLVPPTG